MCSSSSSRQSRLLLNLQTWYHTHMHNINIRAKIVIFLLDRYFTHRAGIHVRLKISTMITTEVNPQIQDVIREGGCQTSRNTRLRRQRTE